MKFWRCLARCDVLSLEKISRIAVFRVNHYEGSGLSSLIERTDDRET